MNNATGVNQPPIYPMNTAPQKTSNGCWTDVLKVGCGFLVGVAVTFLVLLILGIGSGRSAYNLKTIDYESMYDDIDDNNEIRYFDVKSKNGEARIHTGMPRDSVIMLLGKPSRFTSTDFTDEISYDYGPFGTNNLTIEFEDGKVSSVIQY